MVEFKPYFLCRSQCLSFAVKQSPFHTFCFITGQSCQLQPWDQREQDYWSRDVSTTVQLHRDEVRADSQMSVGITVTQTN